MSNTQHARPHRLIIERLSEHRPRCMLQADEQSYPMKEGAQPRGSHATCACQSPPRATSSTRKTLYAWRTSARAFHLFARCCLRPLLFIGDAFDRPALIPRAPPPSHETLKRPVQKLHDALHDDSLITSNRVLSSADQFPRESTASKSQRQRLSSGYLVRPWTFAHFRERGSHPSHKVCRAFLAMRSSTERDRKTEKRETTP
jgi:hypothetical protein